MHLRAERLDLICTLLQLIGLPGLIHGRNWRVGVPAGSPFADPDIDSTEPSGIIYDLFENSEGFSAVDNFSLVPMSNWFEPVQLEQTWNMTVLESGSLGCIAELNTPNGSDLCLFVQSRATLEALEFMPAASNLTITSVPWVTLRPVLLAACLGPACPWKIEPSVLGAMYFIRPFHSSVWSLLLLYSLTTAGLLFVFEVTHTYRFGKKAVQPVPDENRFTLSESFMCVALAMFLQPFHKHPKSWAGMILTVFWYAFCLICIITYALGVSRLLFQTEEQVESHNALKVSMEKEIACERHSFWCNLLHDQMHVPITEIDLPRDESGYIILSLLDWQKPLLVDQLTAGLIMHQTINVNESGRNLYVHWLPAHFGCSESTQQPTFLSLYLNFAAAWPAVIRSVNYYIRILQESGALSRLANKWNLDFVQDTKLCRPTEAAKQTAPVRMYQMNGPLLFMIIGALSSLVGHFCQLFYYSVAKKNPPPHKVNEDDPELNLLT
ncbi:hypothetical protein CRM22_004075 [Opisthorchis felineus]|uniref:Ionotropic glutamate receptor C-terminal domain-containing protein n=2 Tax=Opisthorchis felineus TaxID=147828 RepID=A0A4S2LY25_OPIFE|nr:hypothetical protein CRM22_004075 [Opisthorchis felineus]